MKVTTLATLAAAVATAGGVFAVFASTSAASPSAPRATVNRSQFDKPQQNPYFPLEPGTVSRYRGTEDGEPVPRARRRHTSDQAHPGRHHHRGERHPPPR